MWREKWLKKTWREKIEIIGFIIIVKFEYILFFSDFTCKINGEEPSPVKREALDIFSNACTIQQLNNSGLIIAKSTQSSQREGPSYFNSILFIYVLYNFI